MYNTKSVYLIAALLTVVIIIIVWGMFVNTPTPQEQPPLSVVATEPLELSENSEFLEAVVFTDEEKAYLQQLQQKGLLTIALRQLDFSYLIHENGEITGFNYLFAHSFADALEVDLQIKIVKWNAFFELDGVVPEDLQSNPERRYTPTLLKEVDLYCEYMTILPWREKLFTMVPIFPVKQMLIKRNNVTINSLYDLDNKNIGIFPNTSYHQRLLEIEQQENLHFNYIFAEDENDQNLLVSKGEADCSVQDSIIALRDITHYDNLEIVFPISDLQFYGWAVRFEQAPLASILTKYVNYAKASGEFDRIWRTEYGITHLEYLKLIDFQ